MADDSTTDGGKPRNSTAPAGQGTQLLLLAVGGVAVLGVFVLVGLGSLSPSEGLPWIVATTSALANMRTNGRK